jgi:aldehyde:ferredoxin oxidoreductase
MLKYAGWDGIVIEGKADKPVWIDIRNEDVKIKGAQHLWGLDTWKTQEEIWREVSGRGYGKWRNWIRNSDDSASRGIDHWSCRENLSVTCLPIHDAGHSAGQGGFGAVWGSKKLKAISVIGTGAVQVSIQKDSWRHAYGPGQYSLDLKNIGASWLPGLAE